jgi:hypothetical protein
MFYQTRLIAAVPIAESLSKTFDLLRRTSLSFEPERVQVVAERSAALEHVSFDVTTRRTMQEYCDGLAGTCCITLESILDQGVQ